MIMEAEPMKTAIYILAWVALGAVLCDAGVTTRDWQYWAVIIATAVIVLTRI